MTRKNEFEESVNQAIRKVINVQLTFDSESVRAIEVLKQSSNKNKLFYDACSTYLTPTGRQKQTEFVLHCPIYGIDMRIECKSRQTYGLLGEIKSELDYVNNIPESRYCLVLTENLLTPYFLAELKQNVLEKGLTDKVWIGSKKQLKKMLKKSMS